MNYHDKKLLKQYKWSNLTGDIWINYNNNKYYIYKDGKMHEKILYRSFFDNLDNLDKEKTLESFTLKEVFKRKTNKWNHK